MRLIDADALIAELNDSHFPGAPYVDAGISIAIGKVCDAPTIEPEREEFPEECQKCVFSVFKIRDPERKKGRWMHDKDDMIISGYCSCCGWAAAIMETDVSGMPFCPNCGADLRGV